MTPQRMEAAERGLTVQGRKVLDATPVGEAWALAQVIGELRRNHINMDPASVEKHLCLLIEAGLVKTDGGKYRRVEARPRVEERATLTVVERAEERPAQDDTLSRLAALSDQFRSMAAEIDDIALRVEERIAKAGEGAEKFNQLKAILKGVVE